MSASDELSDLIDLAPRLWLMKSEPGECSFADIQNAPQHRVPWTGIRNYQARNFIRDDMKVGDLAYIYHSSCKEPGIAGVGCIVSEPYPDPLQFDSESEYFDPKSTQTSPRWLCVDVEAVRPCTLIPLKALRAVEALADMRLMQRGNRLSITPVTPEHFRIIADMLD